MRGHIVVLEGPSGAGKTTSIVTCTTRSPRMDEIEGTDYYFFVAGPI